MTQWGGEREIKVLRFGALLFVALIPSAGCRGQIASSYSGAVIRVDINAPGHTHTVQIPLSCERREKDRVIWPFLFRSPNTGDDVYLFLSGPHIGCPQDAKGLESGDHLLTVGIVTSTHPQKASSFPAIISSWGQEDFTVSRSTDANAPITFAYLPKTEPAIGTAKLLRDDELPKFFYHGGIRADTKLEIYCTESVGIEELRAKDPTYTTERIDPDKIRMAFNAETLPIFDRRPFSTIGRDVTCFVRGKKGWSPGPKGFTYFYRPESWRLSESEWKAMTTGNNTRRDGPVYIGFLPCRFVFFEKMYNLPANQCGFMKKEGAERLFVRDGGNWWNLGPWVRGLPYKND